MRSISLIALVIVLSCSAFAQKALRTGSAAPAFAAASMDGNYYDLAAMRGQVVVLTFWSTKCEICRNEIPKLNTFSSRYDEKKVTFLALSLDNEDKLGGYLRAHPFNFHVLANSFGVLLQYADRDSEGNVDMGFPSYFVIDKAGNVAYRSNGWDRTDELSSRISQLLAAN
ncbi:MAG: TlpA disulfide reductase family protein [Acidobacteriota bacterium]